MIIIETKELELDCVTRDEEAKVTEVDRVIDDVSLQIETESFVAILGHNGFGKSTLARTLNGILLPSDSTALVSGMNTTDDAELLDIHREVGMIFQNPDNQIAANFVKDDMGFDPEDLGVPTEEVWRGVDATLKAIGMTAFRLKSPNHLSGEQKQRVAITGIMAMHPKCIVLDEPTAILDPNGRGEAIRTITEFSHSEGVTIVLIIHYMEEVIGADRLVVMDDGKVIMDGTPREVFAQMEELKRLRLDISQAVEFAYGLRQRGVSLPDSVLTMEELTEAMLPLWKES